MEDNRVIIDETDGLYSLYDEAGGCVEADFDSYEEAEQYALDNGMEVVDLFGIK